MPIGFGSTIGIQAMSGRGERPELPLNEICLRAVNKYINNYDEARSLKESIEKDGLNPLWSSDDINRRLLLINK